MCEIIIFDFDGTLVNLNADWPEIKTCLKTLLSDFGFNTEVAKASKSIIEGLEYVRINSGQKKEDELREKIIELLELHECKAVDGFSEIIKESGEILDHLISQNVKMAILSNNTTKAISSALKKFGLEKYFGLVIGRDSVRNPKPNPEGIQKILDHFKAEKGKVLMVGDSPFDVAAAKAAGVKCVGVLTGEGHQSELRQAKPDCIIENLSWIKTLNLLNNPRARLVADAA